jgi:prepilin-type processing-associated H-X9-DG protein
MIFPYVKSEQLFDCPDVNSTFGNYYDGYYYGSGGGSGAVSYGYNLVLATTSSGYALAGIEEPTLTPLILDSEHYLSDPDYDGQTGWATGLNNLTLSGTDDNAAPPADRHLETVNIAFADGHVKSEKRAQWMTQNAGCTASFDSCPTASSGAPYTTDPVWQKWDPALQQ